MTETASNVPMSNIDRAWLRMDDPDNLMIINSILCFDEPLPEADLRHVIERRLLTVDRFRYRIGNRFENAREEWIEDSVDLDRHLHRHTLAGLDSQKELTDLVSGLVSEPLPLDRPLWAVHQIEGYRGGTTLLFRLHHCIGDGIALMLVLLSVTDLEPGQGTTDTPDEERNPLVSLFRQSSELGADLAREHLARVMPEAVTLLTRPSEAMRSANRFVKRLVQIPTFGKMSLRPSDPKTLFKGELGIPKRVAWSDPVDLERVKAVKDANKSTVNDVLLTAVAGGLGQYLDFRRQTSKGVTIRGVIPVSLRPLEEMGDLGNYFGLVFLPLPLGIRDPFDRLYEIRKSMRSLKRSAEPMVVLNTLRLLGMSPEAIQNLVIKIFGTKATAVMTNVPGPRNPLFLCGREIKEMMFWVPQSGRLGMGISIASYADSVRLGVITDEALVPDPDRIVDGFVAELDEMYRRR